MTNMLGFGGVNYPEEQKKYLVDLFDEAFNDDGTASFISKQTYHNEDEAYKDFDYKLVITAQSMRPFLTEDEEGYNDVHIEILMVPLPEFLADTKTKEIIQGMGLKDRSELTLRDIYEFGDCPSLAKDCIVIDPDEDIYNVTDSKVIADKLNDAATVADTLNRFRGFSLDRAWNVIGSNGWDLLDEMILGTDPTDNLRKRLNECLQEQSA